MSESIRLGVGEIISGTFATISGRSKPYLIYVLCMAVATTALDLTLSDSGTVLAWIGDIIGIIGDIVACYAVLRYVFGLEGLVGERKFGSGLVSYLGATILTWLGAILGLFLLIVPGVIVMARWGIAAGIVVTEDAKASDALKRSWELTRATQWTIVGAYSVIVLIVIVFFGLIGAVFSYSPFEIRYTDVSDPLFIGVTFGANLVAQLLGALSIASVVFLTRRLTTSRGQLEQVFA